MITLINVGTSTVTQQVGSAAVAGGAASGVTGGTGGVAALNQVSL
jgi:hypothetical protein